MELCAGTSARDDDLPQPEQAGVDRKCSRPEEENGGRQRSHEGSQGLRLGEVEVGRRNQRDRYAGGVQCGQGGRDRSQKAGEQQTPGDDVEPAGDPGFGGAIEVGRQVRSGLQQDEGADRYPEQQQPRSGSPTWKFVK